MVFATYRGEWGLGLYLTGILLNISAWGGDPRHGERLADWLHSPQRLTNEFVTRASVRVEGAGPVFDWQGDWPMAAVAGVGARVTYQVTNGIAGSMGGVGPR